MVRNHISQFAFAKHDLQSMNASVFGYRRNFRLTDFIAMNEMGITWKEKLEINLIFPRRDYSKPQKVSIKISGFPADL
jgi:hypothetical protein